MATPNNLLERFPTLIPYWLAWPMSALAAISAFAGAGLLFASAALGSVAAAVWGGISFLVAAVTWHVADYAQTNRPV
jgi:4-amino-4-deoxy-L-arabinose transferase-like glycosyltransferase